MMTPCRGRSWSQPEERFRESVCYLLARYIRVGVEPSLFLELVRTITFFSPVSSTLLLSLYLNKAGTRAREIPNTEYNGTERHTPNLFRCEGEMVYLKQFYELQYI